MEFSLVRRWLAVGAAVVVVVGGVVWFSFLAWPRLIDPSTSVAATALAGIVAATAGCIGAGASAVAAVAAFRAAKESHRTALDAREALGLAMEPELKVDFVEIMEGEREARPVVFITNVSRWAATDVVFEARFDDGRHVREKRDLLPRKPDPDPRVQVEPSRMVVELGDREPRPWDDPYWRGKREWQDEFVLTYSDERGLLRWRRTRVAHRSVENDGRIGSEGEGWSGSSERIR